MLVDDDDADNAYHRVIIEETGHEVKVYSMNHPLKALDCWKKSCDPQNTQHPLPDVVLLDVNMPALNGYELLDEIRKVPDPLKRIDQTKIFILSTSINPPPNIALEKYEDLIMGYYQKPLTKETFQEIMEKHISERNEKQRS